MSIANPTEQELRELYFLFPWNKPSELAIPRIEPIQLTSKQLNELLKLLQPLSRPKLRDYIRQCIAGQAKYFSNRLWQQNRPSHKEAIYRVRRIQSTARDLLNLIRTDRSHGTTLHYYALGMLQQAATEYGRKVGRPAGCNPQEIPWNFWDAYRLPSAIDSVALIAHWATLAEGLIQRYAELDKEDRARSGRTGTYLGKPAARVLIHALANIWGNAKGKPPSDNHPPFIKFATQFVWCLKSNLTDKQRRYVPTIEDELDNLTSTDAVRAHLRTYLGRLRREKMAKLAKQIS